MSCGRISTALALTLFATGCQSGPGPGAGNFCDVIDRPPRPSPEDVAAISDGLARDLLFMLEYGEQHCGWRPQR